MLAVSGSRSLACIDCVVDGSDVEVKCTRISALLPSSEREVTFALACSKMRKKVKDEVAAGPDGFAGPMADLSNENTLQAPCPVRLMQFLSRKVRV